jgi:Trk-type K+ transport system membrane component
MNWTVVQRILGLLLMVFSITMLPPILVSIWYADQAWLSFIEGFALTLVAGIVCWLPVRRERRELRLRDGFLVVASFWTVLGTFGAAPLYFDDSLSLTVTDAIFESISGPPRGRRFSPAWTSYRAPYSIIGNSCNGSAAWASSSSPSPCCPCWVSAVCSCTRTPS